MELSVNEKLGIIEKEYSIEVDDKIREDVSVMCNLSQGILEKGVAKGIAEGMAKREENIILNMHENNFTLEQIAIATKKSIEEVESIIKKKMA